jgi:hypothetical protein
MGRKKESKPLLSAPGSSSQNTYIVKKIHKGRPVKSKLASVSESETGGHAGKESSKDKCLEKDVDESLTGESKGDEGRTAPQSFGVRSYLHHFYETVNNPNTSGQVITLSL